MVNVAGNIFTNNFFTLKWYIPFVFGGDHAPVGSVKCPFDVLNKACLIL
jgi:hypothetical protein